MTLHLASWQHDVSTLVGHVCMCDTSLERKLVSRRAQTTLFHWADNLENPERSVHMCAEKLLLVLNYIHTTNGWLGRCDLRINVGCATRWLHNFYRLLPSFIDIARGLASRGENTKYFCFGAWKNRLLLQRGLPPHKFWADVRYKAMSLSPDWMNPPPCQPNALPTESSEWRWQPWRGRLDRCLRERERASHIVFLISPAVVSGMESFWHIYVP